MTDTGLSENHAEFASSPDYCSPPVNNRGFCGRLLAIRDGWPVPGSEIKDQCGIEMRGRIQTGHPATTLNWY